MKASGITCPECNVPMSVKRMIYVNRQVLHVIHVCVICKAERGQYLKAAATPVPANDTAPKLRSYERSVNFPSGPDRGN